MASATEILQLVVDFPIPPFPYTDSFTLVLLYQVFIKNNGDRFWRRWGISSLQFFSVIALIIV
ncbi:hypothetical protein M595_1461 [Lyngbya aestuarii BL J]|uniref:Uncharacterized protein n=1 Tax=Lyngbya aestuarii BL J TaxID=1348334 RepID=U7QKH8_9CYAN|nr:hypothetical protein M595_4065 [Lyngbya aestuarii BL J]ERT08459.1 hypothetical protein M595_1461 [Lyngbya aestuarii BL J]